MEIQHVSLEVGTEFLKYQTQTKRRQTKLNEDIFHILSLLTYLK
jgi:hypothetical protein